MAGSDVFLITKYRYLYCPRFDQWYLPIAAALGRMTGVGRLLILGRGVPVVCVLCRSGGGCEVRGAEGIIG